MRRIAPVSQQIGKLNEFWHVIALSNELRPGKSLKRSLHGFPVLLWRGVDGEVHALQDCCAHRRSPLSVKDYSAGRIVCPYHGWEYDSEGCLVHVPSDPKACERLSCSVPRFNVLEESGFVWILAPSANASETPPRPDLSAYASWSSTYRAYKFETSVDLLIDNFMDPTHTALVHDGLIRKSSQITEHEMVISTRAEGVCVDYSEQIEQVGFGMQLLFGNSMRTKHRDEFLAPNLVRVTYAINGTERFIALIACTPLTSEDGSENPLTLALIQLRYQFGTLNFLVRPMISMLAKKVLQQDYEITRDQWRNQRVFQQNKEHLMAADAVAARVVGFRNQLKDGSYPTDFSSQQLRIRF